eukprot:TRINITY_DN1263_c0_g2_i1.p1 TRINITY_DN1263_c0_g2~~TRINITY_DN1263_c0_g2_i1.p1  ORF type:complete len:199 (-),score=16.46 TRINITY_DN1263_c0_g2_i1:856-1452(-)
MSLQSLAQLRSSVEREKYELPFPYLRAQPSSQESSTFSLKRAVQSVQSGANQSLPSFSARFGALSSLPLNSEANRNSSLIQSAPSFSFQLPPLTTYKSHKALQPSECREARYDRTLSVNRFQFGTGVNGFEFAEAPQDIVPPTFPATKTAKRTSASIGNDWLQGSDTCQGMSGTAKRQKKRILHSREDQEIPKRFACQ